MYKALTLSDSLTQLTLVPELGGAIARWQRLLDGLDLLRPMPVVTADTTARQLGAFLLIPWSNRIVNGGIHTPKGWVDLPNTPNQAYAIHGTTWNQPWQVLEYSQNTATLFCTSLTPLFIQATQSICLENGNLKIQVEVTHLDERPFWHGYGWHPFFPRTPETQLNVYLTQMWRNNEQGLSMNEVAIPQMLNFSVAKNLPDCLIDHAFSGWDRHYIVKEIKKCHKSK